MSKSKLEQKQVEIKHLDTATQAILERIDKNDRRLRIWAFVTLTLLMLLGIAGIYKQNLIATHNQQHIDCIIKDLATPLPSDSRSKYISELSTDCKINFTR